MTEVTVGYVHGLSVHAQFMSSVLGAVRQNGYDVLEETSGPNISAARNRLAERFLASGSEWLFMCDTDMVFRPDAIARLLARDTPLIGGLAMVDGNPPFPAMYRRVAEASHGMGMFMSVQDWPAGACIEVDVTGTACLLARRDVFIQVRRQFPERAAQWFRETVIGSSLIGEDFTFCMRAAAAGYPVRVDTAVKFGHIKSSVIGEVG